MRSLVAALVVLSAMARASQTGWALSLRKESCDSACARTGKGAFNSIGTSQISSASAISQMHSFFNCFLSDAINNPRSARDAKERSFSPGYLLGNLLFVSASGPPDEFDADMSRMCCCGSAQGCTLVSHDPPLPPSPECWVFTMPPTLPTPTARPTPEPVASPAPNSPTSPNLPTSSNSPTKAPTPASRPDLNTAWALSYRLEDCVSACSRVHNAGYFKQGSDRVDTGAAIFAMNSYFNCPLNGQIQQPVEWRSAKWAPAIFLGIHVYSSASDARPDAKAGNANRMCCCSSDLELCDIQTYDPPQPQHAECGLFVDSPTMPPTWRPTRSPVETRSVPTQFPIDAPTLFPTNAPSEYPTNAPTRFPTNSPVGGGPTLFPTNSPVGDVPTLFPTNSPTQYPVDGPTLFPTNSPTGYPTPVAITQAPTLFPSNNVQTDTPTASPGITTNAPTTSAPNTASPTASPLTGTDYPTPQPSASAPPTTKFPTSFPTR